VKTKTNTVTTKPKKTTAEPAPLTGAALGSELNDQGKALIDSGSYAEAIPILQRAVNAFPPGSTDLTYAFALYNLANALRLAGQPEQAIPLLEQRLQISDNQRGVVAHELALAEQEAGVTSSGGTGAPGPGGEGDEGGAGPEKKPKPEKSKGSSGGIESD
jgi:tetratricopeptide (TPR) repeat protein